MTSIGIDFGTIKSFVANNGVVIENSFGSRYLESVVGFSPSSDKVFVGSPALNQYLGNAPNTVFNAKTLVGTQYNDKRTQQSNKYYNFNIADKQGHTFVQLDYNNEKGSLISPQAISSKVLKKLKEIAEEKLGKPIDYAVVAFPSSFNYVQQQNIKNATEMAGFNNVDYISETMAVAIAYGVSNKIDHQRKLLIYDLGGGKFDVSVVVIDKNKFEMVATRGDNHLGGENFTQLLVDHCIQKFAKENSGKDLSTNPKSMRRLLAACEHAKKQLSISESTTIEIDYLFDGCDFAITITREEFEELAHNLILKTYNLTIEVIKSAKIRSALDIDDLILVGGSTRIPIIRQIMDRFLRNRKSSKAINADEAVVYGASVLAQDRVSDKPQFIVKETLCYPAVIFTEDHEYTLKQVEIPYDYHFKLKGNFNFDKLFLYQYYAPSKLLLPICKFESQVNDKDATRFQANICSKRFFEFEAYITGCGTSSEEEDDDEEEEEEDDDGEAEEDDDDNDDEDDEDDEDDSEDEDYQDGDEEKTDRKDSEFNESQESGDTNEKAKDPSNNAEKQTPSEDHSLNELEDIFRTKLKIVESELESSTKQRSQESVFNVKMIREEAAQWYKNEEISSNVLAKWISEIDTVLQADDNYHK